MTSSQTQTAMFSDPAYRISDTWLLVGRILIVVMYVFSGAGKFADLGGTAAMIASKGLPMPSVLAFLAAALEVLGGLMVLVGWHTRWAAVALAVFTAIATYYFHDYWNVTGPGRMDQMIHAMKNLSVIAGFILLAAAGGGRYSVDGRVRVRSAL